MKARAFIASVGARTPLGRDAAQTGLLLRTGVPALAAAPLVDEEGEQVTMSFDPTLDPYASGEERAARLACAALEEAIDPLGDESHMFSRRLILCVDQPLRPLARGDAAPGARLASRVETWADELSPGIAFEVCGRGAASAAYALGSGLEALAARKLDVLVVGGAHSDHDPETIAALGSQGRLFSPQNLDAVIPGEAAAFVAIMREDTARRLDLEPAVRIAGIGTGVARARHDNDESAYEADALIGAIRSAAEELSEAQLQAGWVLTDHTFETRRIYEWQTMMTRTHALWGAPYHVESPAQRIGNLGAAAMPLQMVLASEGWRRGYAPSAIAVAYAGSDGGERGAILMFSNV